MKRSIHKIKRKYLSADAVQNQSNSMFIVFAFDICDRQGLAGLNNKKNIYVHEVNGFVEYKLTNTNTDTNSAY